MLDCHFCQHLLIAGCSVKKFRGHLIEFKLIEVTAFSKLASQQMDEA